MRNWYLGADLYEDESFERTRSKKYLYFAGSLRELQIIVHAMVDW